MLTEKLYINKIDEGFEFLNNMQRSYYVFFNSNYEGNREETEDPFISNIRSLEKSLENLQTNLNNGEHSRNDVDQVGQYLESLGDRVGSLSHSSAQNLYKTEKAFYENLRQKLSPVLISGKSTKAK